MCVCSIKAGVRVVHTRFRVWDWSSGPKTLNPKPYRVHLWPCHGFYLYHWVLNPSLFLSLSLSLSLCLSLYISCVCFSLPLPSALAPSLETGTCLHSPCPRARKAPEPQTHLPESKPATQVQENDDAAALGLNAKDTLQNHRDRTDHFNSVLLLGLFLPLLLVPSPSSSPLLAAAVFWPYICVLHSRFKTTLGPHTSRLEPFVSAFGALSNNSIRLNQITPTIRASTAEPRTGVRVTEATALVELSTRSRHSLHIITRSPHPLSHKR